jgi:hypothetical protein
LIREAEWPVDLRNRVFRRLGAVAILSSLFALVEFFVASALSNRTGSVSTIGSVFYGVWLLLAVNAYFRVWRFMQVGWNFRYRKPVLSEIQLVSQKDGGIDRRTTIYLVQLNRKAVFGRTNFAWSPRPFLVAQTAYVFPGRYAVMVADGSPPLAATIRM